ncbi:MAG: DMT family transporter [Verrucomicrobia bacterium]|nr:DMT family transporter [Verrucomicrobiota bacterium]
MTPLSEHRHQAALVLVFCCACWAFSFPAMKALEMVGQRTTPGNSSFFFANLCVAYRFAAAALILLIFNPRRLQKLTRSEFRQGIGIGLFGACGLVLQMDGMAYTHASTCAFLTQGYCVWLPIWFALRHRRWPAGIVLAASALVLLGGAILAGVDLRHLRLGRGEWETLAGSVMFTGQILWLERPEFRGNDVIRFSWVMFVTLALVTFPVAALTAHEFTHVWSAFQSPYALGLLAILVVPCTLVAFLLANRWQPEVPATEAGLLYSTEPVFTSAVSLVIPAWISVWSGVNYPNEHLTPNLLIGGGLILTAIVMLQLHAARTHPSGSST